MKRIVHQGLEGSFSHKIARKLFGSGQIYVGAKSFQAIFEDVVDSRADLGVIPIENSLAGSLYENYDNLCRFPLKIIGEEYLRVEHCLLGLKVGESLEQIKRVYSHPKALEQCGRFFKEHSWLEKHISTDTATAALHVAEWQDPTCAAIASSEASKIYGLKVLKNHIEDNSLNYTRFVVIARSQAEEKDFNKCSLVMTLRHEQGALMQVLQKLNGFGVNVTKIESRPITHHPFEYLFYLDFTRSGLIDILEAVCNELQKVAIFIKILGCYRSQSCR